MTTTTALTAGWPFLVARGRRQDYRCLLVPEFLDRAGGRGFLADSVSGVDPAAPPTVMHLADAPGGPITLVYRAHRLTRADLADAPDPHVLDEHGRPLHLLYGLAYQKQPMRDVEPDLVVALAAALSAYRDFWRDEIGFRARTAKHVPRFHPVAEDRSPVRPRFVVDGEPSVPYLSRRCARIVLMAALAVALAAAGLILGNAVSSPGPTPMDVRTQPGHTTHAHNPDGTPRPTQPPLSRSGQRHMTIRIS